jgi:hypothetical protein
VEAVADEPVRDELDVLVARSEPLSELLRRQPALVVARLRVELAGEKLVQLLLRARTQGKGQDHAVHRQARVGPSFVEAGSRQPMDVALQDHTVGVVDDSPG